MCVHAHTNPHTHTSRSTNHTATSLLVPFGTTCYIQGGSRSPWLVVIRTTPNNILCHCSERLVLRGAHGSTHKQHK